MVLDEQLNFKINDFIPKQAVLNDKLDALEEALERKIKVLNLKLTGIQNHVSPIKPDPNMKNLHDNMRSFTDFFMSFDDQEPAALISRISILSSWAKANLQT